MPFHVAKQSLIPAFLTLVGITTIALLCAREGVAVPDLRFGLTQEVLPLVNWGAWLQNFQVAHPHISGWISALLMLYTGASLGRLTVRYNLYGTGTCLSIALYGVAMLGTMLSGSYLIATVNSLLLLLSIKNFCLSYRNGFGFDRIFRGALYLSLLIFIEPSAVVLLLLLWSISNRFHRTTREMMVAFAGLLLPIATVCYVNWALKGEFTAPLRMLYRAFMAGEWGTAMLTVSLPTQIFWGVLLLLNLLSLGLFSTNSYNLNRKARHILQTCSRLLLLTLVALCLPSASVSTLALVVVPSTLLLPVLFIRIHQSIAQLLYPLLIAGAVAYLFF
ncbi:MAG: hypothetical protein IKZ12_01450 [Alistipes sp.]|nr:hypothetical protein [Alistipes sp.]